MRNFILVTGLFMALFVALLIFKVENHWLWAGFIIAWTIAECFVAKEVHISRWQWTAIIAIMCAIDLIVINVI